MAEANNIYSCRYEIVPADCNAQREVSMYYMANKILDVATRHADEWGIGYHTITERNHAWVLARLAIDMERYPHPYDTMIAETWVADFNPHFSERNFRFSTPEGETYGYARSIWFVIDLTTRKSLDISSLGYLSDRRAEKECPIPRQGRQKPIARDAVGTEFKVEFSDIDFNRHFNSGKQIEHVMNYFTMAQLDKKFVKRFEISYMNEAHYGDTLQLAGEETAPGRYTAELRPAGEGPVICRCGIELKERD